MGNSQILVQTNARLKPLINDHLLKTTSVQRPHSNQVPKMAKAYLTLSQNNFCIQDHASLQKPHLPSLQSGIPVLVTYHLIIVTRSQVTHNNCQQTIYNKCKNLMCIYLFIYLLLYSTSAEGLLVQGMPHVYPLYYSRPSIYWSLFHRPPSSSQVRI